MRSTHSCAQDTLATNAKSSRATAIETVEGKTKTPDMG